MHLPIDEELPVRKTERSPGRIKEEKQSARGEGETGLLPKRQGVLIFSTVLKKIPHRHFVFSIPKILRRYFLHDRKLLANLSRCAWESLKVFMQQAVPEKEPIPGAVIAVQTFGDFLGFNPHCHILLTDECFYGEKGMFRVAPPLELKKLEAIFRHKVFRMLLKKGKITEEMVRMLSAVETFRLQRVLRQ